MPGSARKTVEDVKGFRTKEFDRSWKMMKSVYPEYIYKIT